MQIYFKLLIPLLYFGFAECGMYNVLDSGDILVGLKSVNITVRHNKDAGGLRSTIDYDNYTIVGTSNKEEKTANIVVTLISKTSDELAVDRVNIKLDLEAQNNGYWRLVNITSTFIGRFKGEPINLDDMVMVSGRDLVAPRNKSYHCDRFGIISPASTKANNAKLEKSNYTFYAEFLQFQIQTFDLNGTRFGDSYECQEFFSIGILSGIFISAFLVAVLTWGICMIMSVKTMDRFDDPKGKQISFGSND